MGKSTISMAIFNCFLYVHQRVYHGKYPRYPNIMLSSCYPNISIRVLEDFRSKHQACRSSGAGTSSSPNFSHDFSSQFIEHGTWKVQWYWIVIWIDHGLVVEPPLWKIWVRQWEGWHPIYEMENKSHVSNHQPDHDRRNNSTTQTRTYSPTAPTSLPFGFFYASRQHLQQLSIVIFQNLDGSIQIERRQPTEECVKITCLPGWNQFI